MKRKILFALTTLTVAFLLTACGGSSGVSQEEYDAVVAERDKLQEENDILENKLEISVKVAEYKATINAQYEHIKLLYYIGELLSGDEIDGISEVEEVKEKALKSIDAVEETFDFVGNLTELEDEVYEQTKKSLEDIYGEWNKIYDAAMEAEDVLLGNY